MKKMITLIADEGKILTNGIDYGTTISLAAGLSAEDYYEITKNESEKIIDKQIEEEIN